MVEPSSRGICRISPRWDAMDRESVRRSSGDPGGAADRLKLGSTAPSALFVERAVDGVD
jgi:hypothetical protein